MMTKELHQDEERAEHASNNHKMKQTAAFFDFDKTILAVDSQEHEALHLLSWERLPDIFYPFRLMKMLVAEPLQRRHWISSEQHNRTYLSSCKGIPIKTLERHARELYRTKLKHLLVPDMIQCLERHRQQGHVIVLVSSTSEHLLQPFVDEHKPDVWAATRMETDQHGVCTGHPAGPVLGGDQKALHVHRVADELNVDLQSSYAYSDHHCDLPLLEAVGNPVAVNPTPSLNIIAQQRNWSVQYPTFPACSGKGAYKNKQNTCCWSGYSPTRILFAAVLSVVMFAMFVANQRLSLPRTNDQLKWKSPHPHGELSRICIFTGEPLTYTERQGTVSGSLLYYQRIADQLMGHGASILVVEPDHHEHTPIMPYHFRAANASALLQTHRLARSATDKPGGIASFGPGALRGRVQSEVLQFNPQLILVPDPVLFSFDTLERPGYVASKALSIPLVYDIHTNVVECAHEVLAWTRLPGATTLLHLFHRWTLNAATHVLVRSEYQLEQLREKTGFAGRVESIPLGAPMLVSADDDASLDGNVSLPDTSHCTTVFAWVGRLSPEKHISQVVEAVDLLIQATKAGQSQELPCLVVAGPDQGDMPVVRAQVEKHPQQIYYVGTLAPTQVAALLFVSDAVVFIGGVVDTNPRVVREAGQRQRPVISVSSPETTWWQTQDLPFVDLTITTDLAGTLVERMDAFMQNQDQMRTRIEAEAKNSTQMNEMEGIANLITKLEHYYANYFQ